LHAEVLLIELLRRKVVRDDLALLAPRVVHLLQGEEVADIARRSVGVDAAFLYEKLVDGLAVAKNDNARVADLEAEDRTVLLGPLEESVRRTD
jgi:hypothetical protein